MSYRLHSPGLVHRFTAENLGYALEWAQICAESWRRPVHVIDTTQGLVTVIQPPGSWDRT